MGRTLALLAILATALAAILPAVPAVADSGTETWDSDWGKVTISYSGSGNTLSITGSWVQGSSGTGTMTSGSFDRTSRTLTFRYYQPWNKANGGATFAMTADGMRMSGTWKHDGGAGGSWTMTRTTPSGMLGTPAASPTQAAPTVSCSLSGDMKVSQQEVVDAIKFRARPSVSKSDAENAIVGDIAGIARSRGGSGRVVCGSASATVDAPPPPPSAPVPSIAPPAPVPPAPAAGQSPDTSCDDWLADLRMRESELQDDIVQTAIGLGVLAGVSSVDARTGRISDVETAIALGILFSEPNGPLATLVNELNVVQATIQLAELAKAEGVPCGD